jgi:hypothetical protein
MSTLIKRVGTKFICFEETTTAKITSWHIILLGGIYIISAISIVGNEIAALVIAACITAVFGLSLNALGIIFTRIPAYRVFINGTYDHSITIPKTNDKTDQEEICKAVTRLEPVAREYDEHAKKLELIAQGCKK